MTDLARPRRARLSRAERNRVLAAVGHALATDSRVRFGVVFGSFAREQPFADLDVAIALDEPWGYLDLARSRAASKPKSGCAASKRTS